MLFKLKSLFYSYHMTINCTISEKIFKNFTIFNILKRQKLYRSPVIFASILTVSAIICFIMHHIDGAILLGSVLLIVGLGVPAVYFITFFSSLRKQAKLQNLNPPRVAYCVSLTDKDDGIYVTNEKESATYRWKNVYQIYLAKDCIYLFMTQNRAFILPYSDMKEGFDTAFSIIKKRAKDKVTDLRK